MRLPTVLFTAIIFLAAFATQATPSSTNASDLWWNPDESGWGLNVIHQGDTLFASMFVYGSSSQPRWFAASSLVTSGDGPQHTGRLVFTGALFESTGPSYTTSFNPALVTRRQVGTMTFELLGLDEASLAYTVDGVSVTKRLERFTFRPIDLSGSYVGFQNQPASGSAGAVDDEMTITIEHSGSNVTMTTQGSASGSCNYAGTYTQYGQLATVQGAYSCASNRSGSFIMQDVDVTRDGFTSRFTGNLVTAPVFGRMGGVRANTTTAQGDGWRTDLWWVPSESGWGLNIIEQGDTLFASMFVYDPSGQSKWFAASSLAASGSGFGGTFIYSGPLYQSTGPYYGAPFDPNLVDRRQVGTMSFEVSGSGSAFLNYTIDGTAYFKNVSRYTFRNNDFSGSYEGHQVASPSDPGGARTEAVTIDVIDSGSAVTIKTLAASGTCTYSSPRAQSGQLLLLSGGSYSCSNGRSGQFLMQNVDVTFSGFTATFQGNGISDGHMGGVRTGLH